MDSRSVKGRQSPSESGSRAPPFASPNALHPTRRADPFRRPGILQTPDFAVAFAGTIGKEIQVEEACLLPFWDHALGTEGVRAEAPTEPFECAFEEAQEWCNFVVLRPGWLPPDCRVGKVSVRAENLQHASSLRLSIPGNRRSFRLKQFFMDWWIPTSSDTNLTAPGRAFVAAEIVGYWGRDYKGQDAACIHRFGALLELSVLQGQFREEELVSFLEGLQPAVPEAVEQLARLPFAQISYHARKGPGQGRPWNYDLISGCRWSTDREVLRSEFAPAQIYYPQRLPAHFEFDSVGTRHETESRHWEYQLLFRDCQNLTDTIWLRAVGEETEKILWISPGLDRRMGIRLRPVELKHRTVRLGSSSEPYGERVAQWIENGVALEVHARASLHMRESDFLSFLDSLSTE